MILTPQVQVRSYGDVLEWNSLRIVWGNANFSHQQYRRDFSDVPISFVRQTHSNKVLPAPAPNFQPHSSTAHTPNSRWWLTDTWPEGDGQWTAQSLHGLAIVTADCLPVFVFQGGTEPLLIGLHAGWRGLTNGIIEQAFAQIQIALKSNLFAFIGPHIHRHHFEFSFKDLAPFQNYAARLGLSESDVIAASSVSPDKAYVDLTRLAQVALAQLGVPTEQIWTSPVDTYSDPRFFSYRRNPALPGRQVSIAWYGHTFGTRRIKSLASLFYAFA